MLIDRAFRSGFRMYQFDTSSMPSGLAGTTSRITSFRIRIVSASVRLAIW